MATLGAFNPAEAAPVAGPAPTDILRASSFADLLEPIPDAVALLQAVDENAPAASRDENVQLAQSRCCGALLAFGATSASTSFNRSRRKKPSPIFSNPAAAFAISALRHPAWVPQPRSKSCRYL